METTYEMEAQFHAIRRLIASKVGFAAFTSMPGFREAIGGRVVKALKRQDWGVTQAAIDCICALMQPMHDDCDLRQEQLNKSSLLSNNKFLESLLDMWLSHIVRISLFFLFRMSHYAIFIIIKQRYKEKLYHSSHLVMLIMKN